MALTSGLVTELRPGLYPGLENLASNGAVRFIGAGTTTSDVAAISPPFPTDHQPGDIALLPLQTSNQAITVAGWTEGGSSPQGTGTGGAAGSTRLTYFWKRCTSSAETAPTTSDSGDHQVGRVVIIRGCTGVGNPIDVSAGDTAASATAVSIPGATTTVANTLVVAMVADGIDASGNRLTAAANTSLTGVAEQLDFGTAQGTGGGIAVVTGTKVDAGAYSATTGTLSSASVQGRISLALRK